jgi:hypothetical protein
MVDDGKNMTGHAKCDNKKPSKLLLHRICMQFIYKIHSNCIAPLAIPAYKSALSESLVGDIYGCFKIVES